MKLSGLMIRLVFPETIPSPKMSRRALKVATASWEGGYILRKSFQVNPHIPRELNWKDEFCSIGEILASFPLSAFVLYYILLYVYIYILLTTH